MFERESLQGMLNVRRELFDARSTNCSFPVHRADWTIPAYQPKENSVKCHAIRKWPAFGKQRGKPDTGTGSEWQLNEMTLLVVSGG